MTTSCEATEQQGYDQIEQLAETLMARVATIAKESGLAAVDAATIVVDIALRYGCSEADAVGVLLDLAATMIWVASDVSYGPPSAAPAELDRMRDEVRVFQINPSTDYWIEIPAIGHRLTPLAWPKGDCAPTPCRHS